MQQREKFGSRLGFILISAGCAIGLGNVYRFPIITASYGGAAFVLMYIAFLILLGLPAMVAELAVGRASQKSIATSFDTLEKPGTKWHLMKYVGVAGNYLLMMFYTAISGWMLVYFYQYLTGSISGLDIEGAGKNFGNMVTDLRITLPTTYATILLCFGICSMGLQKGVERITKVMMLILFALMVCLAIYSCTLENAAEGLEFYLVPSLENLKKHGWEAVTAAMGQAFFTLSIGIGSIAIFGSYISKERRLTGEAITIISLDTSVALMAGLIIFPAAFTYNPNFTQGTDGLGASFLFTTLTGIFNAMPGGRIVGTLFFLFMLFAAYSTVIAVFENIMSFWLDTTKLSRKKVAIINILLMFVLVLPCLFGFNIWSGIKPLGKDIIDFEDFIVSNNLLPLGALVYVLFCTYNKHGWGWANFMDEANAGQGVKFPNWLRIYVKYILPLIILTLWVQTYIEPVKALIVKIFA